MDYSIEILKILRAELEPYLAPDGKICIDGVLTSAKKINDLLIEIIDKESKAYRFWRNKEIGEDY